MITIGKQAPDFTAQAAIKNEIKELSLSTLKNQYKVLIFYPLDFTFVCPTELHAFQDRMADFQQRNTIVMGISIDSVYSHLAWLKTAKKYGGIAGINFPLISDIHKTISTDYGVLNDEGVALRGTFILDKNNCIQVASVNNLSLGRNVAEVLRLIDALQQVEKCGEVCPANWQANQKTMQPTDTGVKEYFGS